jgi:hypothetical protein
VAQAPAGAFLAPGLRGGQAARVTVWNTECQPFLGRVRESQRFWGGAIFSSRQPATFPARATELLRLRQPQLQTAGLLPDKSHRASEAATSSTPDNWPPSWPKQHSFWESEFWSLYLDGKCYNCEAVSSTYLLSFVSLSNLICGYEL